MTVTMNNVMNDIETLSSSEKGFIAQYLIASLDTIQDENAPQKWAELAKSRYEELKSGEVKGISWDEIKKNIFDGFVGFQYHSSSCDTHYR